MCGIFGYIGRISSNAIRAHSLIAELAIASEARGTDATGFSSRTSLTGDVVLDKMPVRASSFIKTSYAFKELKKVMPDTFIGHTRLGTGSTPKINNNNHPFPGDRFNMVHNGVVPSWRTIKSKHELDVVSETDSEVILRSFEKRMLKEDCAIKSSEWVLDNIWGNMAIALLDKNSPNIWLFRNENPIVVFEVDGDVFGNPVTIFCSTKSIFEKAWEKVFYKDKLPRHVFLDDHVSYKLSLRNDSGDFEHLSSFEIDVRNKFKKYNQYTSYDDYADYWNSHKTSKEYVKPKLFLSKPIDIKRPELGSALTQSEIDIIAKSVSSKEGKEKTKIDYLTIDEFASARAVVLVASTLDRELKNAIQTG